MIDFFKNLLQNPGDILKQAVASTSENISNTLSNAYTDAKDLVGGFFSNDKSESVSPQATNQTSVALRNTIEELNNANDMNDAGTSSKINTTVNQITAGSQTTSVTAMKPSPRSHPSNNSFASISSRDAVLI
jgi:hypothetical protein